MLARRIRTAVASTKSLALHKSMSRKGLTSHARLLRGAQGGVGPRNSLRNVFP